MVSASNSLQTQWGSLNQKLRNHEIRENPTQSIPIDERGYILGYIYDCWWSEVEKSTKINIFGAKIDQKVSEKFEKNIIIYITAL